MTLSFERQARRAARPRPLCQAEALEPARPQVQALRAGADEDQGQARKGTNRVVFAGRLSRRRSLKPGAYRLTAVARDSQGARSKRKRTSFRLLRAKRRKRR